MQVANVDTTCRQQAQQPAFHKVVQWQYYSEVAKSTVIRIKFVFDVTRQKLLWSANKYHVLYGA